MSSALYRTDFYAWIQAQVHLLRTRQFEALDLENLLEEVDSLARQQHHLLHHRLETLLTHLVAWWGTIPERCIRWEGTIAAQRYELQDLLADSPSLAVDVAPHVLRDAWTLVRQRSAEEWPVADFPPDCPWSLAELMDEEFFPADDTFVARPQEVPDAVNDALDPDRR